MKKLLILLVVFTMIIPSVAFADARASSFDKFNLREVLPGWDIQILDRDIDEVKITCPNVNSGGRLVATDLYAITNRCITNNTDDYFKLHIIYKYSSEITDEQLDAIMDIVEMTWPSYGDQVGHSYTVTETSYSTGGSVKSLNIHMDINGNSSRMDDVKLYYENLNRLAKEAREYSNYQLDQLDYFVKWLGNNASYTDIANQDIPYEQKLIELTLKYPNYPSKLLNEKEGVCSNYAAAVHEFCRTVGIPSFVFTSSSALHAWNCVYIDGQWYQYDATLMSKLGVTKEILQSKAYVTSATIDVSQQAYEVMKGLALKDKVFVAINGTKMLAFDQQPVIENGRTLVPLRVIFEELGAGVVWDDATQTVTATKDGTEISLTIGSNTMYVNGEAKTLDVAAKVINGRTMVPARAVAESLDCYVDWIAQLNTVNISGAF